MIYTRTETLFQQGDVVMVHNTYCGTLIKYIGTNEWKIELNDGSVIIEHKNNLSIAKLWAIEHLFTNQSNSRPKLSKIYFYFQFLFEVFKTAVKLTEIFKESLPLFSDAKCQKIFLLKIFLIK